MSDWEERTAEQEQGSWWGQGAAFVVQSSEPAQDEGSGATVGPFADFKASVESTKALLAE